MSLSIQKSAEAESVWRHIHSPARGTTRQLSPACNPPGGQKDQWVSHNIEAWKQVSLKWLTNVIIKAACGCEWVIFPKLHLLVVMESLRCLVSLKGNSFTKLRKDSFSSQDSLCPRQTLQVCVWFPPRKLSSKAKHWLSEKGAFVFVCCWCLKDWGL